MAEWMEVLANFGFPVAMCAALFWYINKSEERHREEVAKLTEALNNNTLIMTEIRTMLGGGVHE